VEQEPVPGPVAVLIESALREPVAWAFLKETRLGVLQVEKLKEPLA
jgi:hypothetical protein